MTYEEWWAYEKNRRRKRPFSDMPVLRYKEWCLACNRSVRDCNDREHYKARLNHLPVEKAILGRSKQRD